MHISCARASACVLAALAAAVFTACRGDARRADPDEFATVRIGTFVDKHVAFIADVLSTETLVGVGFDGRPSYRLAESAVVSEDGTTITVNLRRTLRFHSGEPVAAERVRQILSQKITAAHPEISSIETVGTHALMFRLRRPHSFKPVDLGDYSVDSRDDLSLRTGPFRIATLGSIGVLERFTGYYQGIPTVSKVEIHQYPNSRAAWTAMMRGEVNFLHEVNRDAIEFIEAGGNIKAYAALRPYVISLVFSTKHDVLRRRNVRIALNEAIDRAEIVQTGMRGHGVAADGPFWLHHWAHPRGRLPSTYNPEASRLRLDAAGLRNTARSPEKMPSRFAFRCLVMQGLERIALVVQRQLNAVGVDTDLRLVPVEDFDRVAKAGDFDAFIAPVASGRTLRFPYRFWHSRDPMNRTGYASADEALDRLSVARSDDEVKVAVADVMRVLREDPPAVFLAFPREARAVDRSFEVPYEPEHDIFGTLWRVKRAEVKTEVSR